MKYEVTKQLSIGKLILHKGETVNLSPAQAAAYSGFIKKYQVKKEK